MMDVVIVIYSLKLMMVITTLENYDDVKDVTVFLHSTAQITTKRTPLHLFLKILWKYIPADIILPPQPPGINLHPWVSRFQIVYHSLLVNLSSVCPFMPMAAQKCLAILVIS